MVNRQESRYMENVSGITQSLAWQINCRLALQKQKLVIAHNPDERRQFGLWRVEDDAGKVIASRVRPNRLAADLGLIGLAASR